jgi:formiminoglutamase
MSGGSSNAGAWSSLLDPAAPPRHLAPRAEDPRLVECVEFWSGDAGALRPGRPALLGFPQDEGVRRAQGRTGSALAPREIRQWLYRLTPWDGLSGADLGALRVLDLGDVHIEGDLEETQWALGEVVGALLKAEVVPVVLGGGHETAFGHYLGYANARRPAGVINLDAHLDVRPALAGEGHSGSPFRQMMHHQAQPLPGDCYACLGAQPQSVSRDHVEYVRKRGGTVRWAASVRGNLVESFFREGDRLASKGVAVYLSLDADVVRSADVPGISAPNPLGLPGEEVAACVRGAGASPFVSSFDLVEINPHLDRDGQSARWAALAIWHFLAGLATRPLQSGPS